MTTAAQRFRMLARAFQRAEICTPADAAKIGIELGWIERYPSARTLSSWRRMWADEGIVVELQRISQGGHDPIAMRWASPYREAYERMREYYGQPASEAMSFNPWRVGQALGMIVHHGYVSCGEMSAWCAERGDPTAQTVSWGSRFSEALRYMKKHGLVKRVTHADGDVRYYLPQDHVPIHEQGVMDHMLQLVKEKPRTIHEIERLINATRREPVSSKSLDSARSLLTRTGRLHTQGRGNRYTSSLIQYGPEHADAEVWVDDEDSRERVTQYNRNPHWDAIYSGEYQALDRIEKKAVRAMAVRCRDWRLGKRAKVGSAERGGNDEPVRRLFLKERDDIRETRLSAMALWLSWQPEFEQATV